MLTSRGPGFDARDDVRGFRRRPFSVSVLIRELLCTQRDNRFHRRVGTTVSRLPPKKAARLQGLSLQGPPVDGETLKRFNSEYIVREDKQQDNANNSKRLRNGWSNITSGSIISRKHKIHGLNGEKSNNLHDVRFLSELVKPLQYRLRIHEKEEKEKVLFPSKYGFHRRSHSPTFRRLLEATEKLEIIAQHDTVQTLLKQNVNANEKKISLLKRQDPEIVSVQTETFASDDFATPEVTARSLKKNIQTFITDDALTEKDIWSGPDVQEKCIPGSREPELENVTEQADSDIEDEEEAADEKQDHDHSIKVDFKVAESHATLHLFLPKISSGNKSARTHKTDELDSRSITTDKSDPIVLPSIKVDSIHQIKAYQNPPRKLKRQDTFKKKQKKKPMERIKSAADPDKKIKDHLNDVHTLISIEDHHTDSICKFENCPYHGLVNQCKELS